MSSFAFLIAGFIGIFISGGITLRHFLIQQNSSKELKNRKYIYKTLVSSKYKSKKLKKHSWKR